MKKIDVSNPLVLSTVLAQDGLTNQIPADASSIVEQYNASQDVGFPAITMRPVSVGGEAPDGKDFNGFLRLLSSHLFASQNGGVYTFNQGVSTAIGGYPQGAILSYIDNDGNFSLVQSLIDDNTYDFISNPSYIDGEKWQEIKLGGNGGGLEIGDIGIASLPIDETQLKRKYLNGQTILQSEFVEFTTKLKSAIQTYPNLACTEEEWQDIVTNSKVGQCGKFVINDTNGTIRLPRVVRIQGQLTLANIGDIVDESLPDAKGTFFNVQNTQTDVATGVFDDSEVNRNYTVGGQIVVKAGTMKFSLGRSSSTYQDGAPVQEEAIQYPYFIQLANGTEEEIDPVREIEFNNPFYFGLSKWSQTKIENLSWLLSDGEFKRGDAYVDFYDWILKNKSGAIDSGISVKTTNEAYTDYDFVVNETDGTFRTPLKTLEASGSRIAGNGMTLGMTDGTLYSGVRIITADRKEYYGSATDSYGANVGDPNTSISGLTDEKVVGVTTDPTKSGIETSNQDLFLYWYVGETVQNANLINASNIVNSKANTNLSNLSSQGKGVISNIVAPDTTAPISKSTSGFTADENGWIVAQANTKPANTGIEVKINSIRVNRFACSTSSDATFGFMRVYVGDVITCSNINVLTFYPDRV